MADAKKPFAVKVQDLVYNVEVGVGLRIIQGALYILMVLSLMMGYTALRFAGMKDAEAMDQAQVARNLMEKHHLVTQNIRPASMWYLIENSRQHAPQMERHPDIVNAPLYPALLSVGFLATRSAFASDMITGVFPPEQWIIVPFGHLCTILSGVFVFLIGRRLFDARHGLWAMTAYFFSATVWELSISGLNISLLVLATLGAWHFALAAVDRRQAPEASSGGIGLLVLSLLCAIAAVHTRYIGVVVAPAVALFIGLTLRKQGGVLLAVGFLSLFALALVPWITRNLLVSGGPFGLAPFLALNGSKVFEGDTFERMLTPVLTYDRVAHTLAGKWATNFAQLYDSGLRGLGEGVLTCLFLASFFFRFSKPTINLFRWSFGAGLLLFLLLAPFGGETTQRSVAMFWPLALIYGLAFFFVLLHRMQFQLRILNQGLTLLVVLLTAIPLVVQLLHKRVTPPYPPYYVPHIKYVSNIVRPGELLCTDLPWATAWYGHRDSLLLPLSMDEFYAINDNARRISGLFFTTLTRDRAYVHDLLTGPYRNWFPVNEGRLPPDFPLTQIIPLNNMDELFLTDRTRWGE
jgi:hypothetical protein